MHVEFAADGRTALTHSGDGTTRVWQVEADSTSLSLRPNMSAGYIHLALTRDGTRLLTWSFERGPQMWDLATGHAAPAIKSQQIKFERVGVSADGARLATLLDGRIRIWDAATGAQLRAFGNGIDSSYTLGLSLDGTRLAMVVPGRGLQIRDALAFGRTVTLAGFRGAAWGFEFSDSSERMAAICDDYVVRLWDTDSGAALGAFEGGDGVISVALSSDGTRLLTGSVDGTVRLWDATNGSPIALMRGHSDKVVSVAFGAGGRRLLSTARDGTARIWSATGAPEMVLDIGAHDGVPVALVDGDTALRWASVDGDTVVVRSLWLGLSVEVLRDTARKRLPRELMAGERQRFHLTNQK